MILHLHDTRGTGLVNMMAGLEYGISRFDTSLGGMGGCPFIPGAAGNIATEDAAYFLDTMGIATGVDRARVAEVRDDAGIVTGPAAAREDAARDRKRRCMRAAPILAMLRGNG